MPARAQITVDADSVSALYMLMQTDFRGLQGFTYDLPFSNLFIQVSNPLVLPDRDVWAGRVRADWGSDTVRVDFLLEQYGTIEPVSLLLVVLFCGAFYTGLLPEDGQQWENCYRRALHQCGDAGNIKSFNVSSGITGLSLSASGSCGFECFQQRTVDPPSDPD